jgi:CTP synthase
LLILWRFNFRYDRLLKEVSIVLVGKYTKLEDAYASVIKALQHAALAANHRLDLKVRVVNVKLNWLREN